MKLEIEHSIRVDIYIHQDLAPELNSLADTLDRNTRNLDKAVQAATPSVSPT